MSVPKKKRYKKKTIVPNPIPTVRRTLLLTKKPIPHKYLYIEKKKQTLSNYNQNLDNNPWVYFKKMQNIKNFSAVKFTELKIKKTDREKQIKFKRLEAKKFQKSKRQFARCKKGENRFNNYYELKHYYKMRSSLVVKKKSIVKEIKIKKPQMQIPNQDTADFFELFSTYYKTIYERKKLKINFFKIYKTPRTELREKIKFLKFKNNREIHNVWKRKWYYIPHKKNNYTDLFNHIIKN